MNAYFISLLNFSLIATRFIGFPSFQVTDTKMNSLSFVLRFVSLKSVIFDLYGNFVGKPYFSNGFK